MNANEMMIEALKLMGTGFCMVFAVLAVFYGLVRALMFLFPEKPEENED